MMKLRYHFFGLDARQSIGHHIHVPVTIHQTAIAGPQNFTKPANLAATHVALGCNCPIWVLFAFRNRLTEPIYGVQYIGLEATAPLPTWTFIPPCPLFDRVFLQRRLLACCFTLLSASSIPSSSTPFLASLDPVERHVQGGGLHTWSSVGGSVYLPCARSSIRNTVLYLPRHSFDQGLDSPQVTLHESPRMK